MILMCSLMVMYSYGESGFNPENILLNEIFTREVQGQNQFIELKRDPFQKDVVLKGYSIIVAETTDNLKLSPNLAIRSGWDLGESSMVSDQMYGVVGRRDTQAGNNDILQFSPMTGKTKLMKRDPNMGTDIDTAHNWLKVDKSRILVVALLYSSETSLFDPTIWPVRNIDRKLSGNVLNYVKSNLVDIMIISGINAPVACNDLNFLQEIIGKEAKGMPCPSTATTVFSVNRCGNRFMKFNMEAWKQGKITPGQEVNNLIFTTNFFNTTFINMLSQ